MRALLGLDPDEAGKGAAAAEHFERALEFYGIEFAARFLRGPGSPWRKMIAARRVLDEIVFGEIAERRRSPESGRRDVLSLLLEVRDESGQGFTDREVRDQVMTLMFAGHDTSTSTLTFMMYELAKPPRRGREAGRRAGRGPRGRGPRHREARARDALPRDGARRGAAALPARLDRSAAGDQGLRVRRPRGAEGRLLRLLLLGEPPHPRVLPRARGVHPGALHPRAQGGAAARAPTCRSAAAGGSASASASARPR